MQTMTSNRLTKFRKETLNGIEYLVSPLRMIKEQVLNGSRGPLYYPVKEISDSQDGWNGMPIVVNHPMKNGRFISARSPDVLNQVGVGFVFNSVQAGDALDAEAWVDIKKLRTVNHDLANAVERREPVEVSTGLLTDNISEHGTFNGREYTHVARNYRPDHLALLPGEKGACSIDDGCGLNVNKSFTTPEFVVNCGDNKECSCRCTKKVKPEMVDFQTTNNSSDIDFVANEDGVWRTTDDGARIFIKDGQAYAGGPKGKKLGGKGSKVGKNKSTFKISPNQQKRMAAGDLIDPNKTYVDHYAGKPEEIKGSKLKEILSSSNVFELKRSGGGDYLASGSRRIYIDSKEADRIASGEFNKPSTKAKPVDIAYDKYGEARRATGLRSGFTQKDLDNLAVEKPEKAKALSQAARAYSEEAGKSGLAGDKRTFGQMADRLDKKLGKSSSTKAKDSTKDKASFSNTKIQSEGQSLLKKYTSAYESVQKAHRNHGDPNKAIAKRTAVSKKMKEFEDKHGVTLDTGTGKVVFDFDE